MGLFERFTRGNTLYYPGCLTKFVLGNVEENYRKILNSMGIDFIILKDKEFCCGSPVINAGYEKDFEDLVKKNKEAFNQFGIGRVITNCPACHHILNKHYDIEVEHVTGIIWENIDKLKIKSYNEEITYHDPCHLGRRSGMYEEPRNILRRIGFKIFEFKDNREFSMCCGGGGGLKTNYPELSNRIARKRLEECRTSKLITPCPMCYAHFKENAPNGLQILELSEVLV